MTAASPALPSPLARCLAPGFTFPQLASPGGPDLAGWVARVLRKLLCPRRLLARVILALAGCAEPVDLDTQLTHLPEPAMQTMSSADGGLPPGCP
jgi:hypothetical protein